MRWFVNTLDIVSVVFSTIIVAMVVYSAPPSANAGWYGVACGSGRGRENLSLVTP